jgi:hypothetical protein
MLLPCHARVRAASCAGFRASEKREHRSSELYGTEGLRLDQGCQMAYFQTNLGKFWEGLAMEHVGIVYVHLAIWYILW